MENLIVLNITSEGQLLNPSKLPILYYYNSDDEKAILEDMCKDDAFFKFFETTCLTVEHYHIIEFSYFVYDINTEKYKDYVYRLQDIYQMPDTLMIEYIKQVFLSLYQYVYKKKYKETEDTSVDIILDIYNILKNKFTKKISPETLKQYLRSQLQEKLSVENLNKTINIFENIIE